MKKLLPLGTLALLLQVSALYAQSIKAVGDVHGYVQVAAQPGKQADLVPVFYPSAAARGVVKYVQPGQQQAWAEWSTSVELTRFAEGFFIWPLSGTLINVPLAYFSPQTPPASYYDFWSGIWAYKKQDGTYVSSKLTIATKLALVPFHSLSGLVNQFDSWEKDTTLGFGSKQASLLLDAQGGRQWKIGDATLPDALIDDAFGPYRIRRPTGATGSLCMVLSGAVPPDATTREVTIYSGPNLLFRADGIASQPLLLANGTLNIGVTSPTLQKAANLTENAIYGADKIRIYNRTTGLEETWFFKNAQASPRIAAGWYRLDHSIQASRVPDAEVSSTSLPAGASFWLDRKYLSPVITLKLPLPTNTATLSAPPVPVTSTDGDAMPDFWEKLHFPGMTVSTVTAAADPDQDGLSNLAEWIFGSHPARFDNPGQLEITPVSSQGRVTSVNLSFLAAAGRLFMIETRLADIKNWSPASTVFIGTGARTTVSFSIPDSEISSLSARLFRVAALGFVDSDQDNLLELEEWELGTRPNLADTDDDGVNDGAEVATKGRNPLDYWDNAAFAFTVTGDRQVAPPGGWCRDPLKIQVTRKISGISGNVPLPKNLKVDFLMTRGRAFFAASPESEPGPFLIGQQLQLSPDQKTGEALLFVRMASLTDNRLQNDLGSSPVQGLVSIRTGSDPHHWMLYHESFTLYPSEHLVPPAGLLTWLRSDRETELEAGRVIRWGKDSAAARKIIGFEAPLQSADAAGRRWLRFNGSEALLLDPLIPASSGYSLYLNARGSSNRTASAMPALQPYRQGATGQSYLISGALPAGSSGLPSPYTSTTYRSLGLSVGITSAGLFDASPDITTYSPPLTYSSTWSPGNPSDGLLLGMICPASSSPLLHINGILVATASWPFGSPSTAPHFLPRLIGGAVAGASRVGMFKGDLRDLLLFNRSLSPEEAEQVEDILMSEKAAWVAGGYKTLALNINRDPGSPVVDALPDWWERCFFGNRQPLSSEDPDFDGLTNLEEYKTGTHPLMLDTDGDSLSDDFELSTTGKVATNPVNWDTDNDLIPDNEDSQPTLASNGFDNKDGMGYADGWDWLIRNIGAGTDSDGDGLSDLFETTWLGTPADVANIADADGDGIDDWWEALHFHGLSPAYDPNRTSSYPDGDSLTDFEEFLLGLNPRENDLLRGSSTTAPRMEEIGTDDQGRVKSVGDQTWGYDVEGSLIQKN
ncbi:MAG: hypothetical protein CJBNEKGG_03311 [Prosthecobacter sp.]|nr:hypothetical protein [Prosthecobacter sp.]